MSDILFIGKAKSRLNLLVKMHKIFVKNNVNALFFIGKDKDDIIDTSYKHPNFIYINSMSYEKSLFYVLNTKIILEVCQSQSNLNFSARILEAFYFDKPILSNNKLLKNEKFFNKNAISIFTNESDIDLNFVKEKSKKIFDYSENNYSIDAFFNFIENLFK